MQTKPTYRELEERVRELERKLHGRLSFEYLVKFISTSFVNLPLEGIDEAINRAIRLLGEFIGASKSAIYTVSDDVKTFVNTHAWNGEEPERQGQLGEPIPFRRFGYFWEQLCRSEFVIINRTGDIPAQAELEREWYESNGFRSLLFIPMVLDRKIYGLVSFSGPPHEIRLWPEEFIILIRLIADRFMNLLNRKNVEMALVQSKRLSESLLNATTDSAMLITPAGIILAVNDAYCQMAGKKPPDIIGRNLFTLVPRELVHQRKNQIQRAVAEKKRIISDEEDAGSCWRHVFYPVFSRSGAVDRLAYYTHDITGVRKVERSIRGLTHELIRSQENERLKIAGSLHDNVAQELASLRIHCDALFEQIPGMSPHARDLVSGFSKTIKSSIETVRDLAYELQPPGFDGQDLVTSLYRYCQDFSRKHGIRVDFFSGGMNTLSLDFNTENTVHRIVQEALANIKNHAEAEKVAVRLVASHPILMLRIEDDGKGFDVTSLKARKNGSRPRGLIHMEGRVRLHNGKLRVRSKPGMGTRILAELPLTLENSSSETNAGES